MPREKQSVKMKRTRLRSASSLGWHNELPVEIWSIMIRYVPLTPQGTLDLRMVLRLLSVCKGMLDALMEPILGYLREIMSRSKTWQTTIESTNSDKKPNVACMTWSVIDDLQKKSGDRDLLTRYISSCLDDRRYQTVEHLSNCLSLLHYCHLEGSYCREINFQMRRSSVVSEITLPTMHDSMRNFFYFHPNNKKTVVLSRMAEVSVYEYVNNDVLLERARHCLYKRGLKNENIQAILANSGDHIFLEALLFNIIEEDEEKDTEISERTFKARKARVNDYMVRTIVTEKNKRRLILSDARKNFRANCFSVSDVTCDGATYFYLLSKSREANVKSIIGTQRYHITPL
jgi:hypothetical protein